MMAVKIKLWQKRTGIFCIGFIQIHSTLFNDKSRADVFFQRSDTDLIVAYLLSCAPEFISTTLKRVPTKGFKRIQNLMSVVAGVAQKVVDKQTSLYMDGKKGSKDIMSMLGSKFIFFITPRFELTRFRSPCKSLRKSQDKVDKRRSHRTTDVRSFTILALIFLFSRFKVHSSLRGMSPPLLH